MARAEISTWRMLPLGQLARVERGKFSARPRNDPKYYNGNIPFIQTGDVRNSGGRITSYSQTLNERGLKVSKLFPAGTLFMTIAANIGNLGITEFASACPDSLVAIKPHAGVDQSWLYYALSAKKRQLESIATQNAQANLNLEKLNRFVLEVPSFPEQVAIAEMLDDVSQLIFEIELQIQKKRSLKLGIMQQLLDGRIRLPRFKDAWPVAQLGSLAVGLRGSGLSKEALDLTGMNACILYGELFTAYGRRIDRVVSRTSVDNGVHSVAGDVLIPGSTTTVARDLATASALHVAGVRIGGDTNIIRPSASLDSDWLAYYITNNLGDKIAEIAQGTTIKHLYVRELLRCELPVPDIAEQREIAAALTDAEAELKALDQYYKKIQTIKVGMMQQLLSSHTRLPAMETAP